MPAGLDVTVPLPVSLTVSVKRFSVKVAVTDRAALIVTVQLAPATESQPVHPVKSESAPGDAVNVTRSEERRVGKEGGPQGMPAGLDVTVPLPVSVTVSVKRFSANVAVTDREAPIV